MEQKSKVVLAINEVDFGSTGSIVNNVLSGLEKEGYKTYFACHFVTNNNHNKIQISPNKFIYVINKCLCRIDGSDGFHSKHSTKKFLKKIDDIKPDIIFLNNLHGSYLNIEILFKYIADRKIQCIYTLHDHWVLTGRCGCLYRCTKWTTKCRNCPHKNIHPRAYIFDRCSTLQIRKAEAFKIINGLTSYVCPSQMLFNDVKMSHLKQQNLLVVNNGINLNNNVEKVDIGFDFIANKDKVIFFSLGMPFTKIKGLDLVSKLADELDKDKFVFIVAGIKDKTDVSKNIIDIGFINGREKLNYIYQQADYLLFPSSVDIFGLVVAESLNMGTPTIVFDETGCSEITTKDCGYIVKKGDYEALKSLCSSLKKKTKTQSLNSIKRAEQFSVENMTENYLKIFNDVLRK